ncbi:hypothetical protein ACSJLP_29245 [Gordonia rhizosphera NBRC 16068]
MELDDVVFVTPARDQGEPLPFALRFGRSNGHRVRSTVACDVSGCAPALQRLGWQRLRDGRFVCERPWTLRNRGRPDLYGDASADLVGASSVVSCGPRPAAACRVSCHRHRRTRTRPLAHARARRTGRVCGRGVLDQR